MLIVAVVIALLVFELVAAGMNATRLLCRFGRHTGQERGGTMGFTCPRCGGSFWQKRNMRHITARADAMIAEGRAAEALDYAEREIRALAGRRGRRR